MMTRGQGGGPVPEQQPLLQRPDPSTLVRIMTDGISRSLPPHRLALGRLGLRRPGGCPAPARRDRRGGGAARGGGGGRGG
jgi:hypothetical protein